MAPYPLVRTMDEIKFMLHSIGDLFAIQFYSTMLLCSLNVNSMHSFRRKSGAFSAIRCGVRIPDIITLGDTRCQDLNGFGPTGYRHFISPAAVRPTSKCPTNRHRGVALLIHRKLSPIFKYRDSAGNLVMALVRFSGRRVLIVSTYAPCSDSCNSANLAVIIAQLSRLRSCYDEIVLTGDLNITLHPRRDSYGYKRINNPKSKSLLESLVVNYNLNDPMTHIGATYYKYSRSTGRLLKSSRLDYMLITKGLRQRLHRVHKHSGTFSDHRAIFLDLRDRRGFRVVKIWQKRLRRRNLHSPP